LIDAEQSCGYNNPLCESLPAIIIAKIATFVNLPTIWWLKFRISRQQPSPIREQWWDSEGSRDEKTSYVKGGYPVGERSGSGRSCGHQGETSLHGGE